MQFGTDPEFFIVNPKGEVEPAHLHFPGKDAKKGTNCGAFRIWEGGFNGTQRPIQYFRDGYAVEFNPPGTHCRQLLFSDVATAMRAVLRDLPPGYSLSTTPTVKIDLASLEGAPEDVLQFGCDPSWNAYSMEEERIELDARSFPFRSVGGHMHFSGIIPDPDLRPATQGSPIQLPYNHSPLGVDQVITNVQNLPLLVKMFDLYVGLPLTYIMDRPETYERRAHYGKAGEFRIQNYPSPYKGVLAKGVEYRTPNSDLYNSKALASLAFGAARQVIVQFEALKKKWDPKKEPLIRDAVNKGERMEELLSSLENFYTPDLLKKVKVFYQTTGKDKRLSWFEDGNDYQQPIPKNKAEHDRIRIRSGMYLSLPGFQEGWTEFVIRNSELREAGKKAFTPELWDAISQKVKDYPIPGHENGRILAALRDEPLPLEVAA